MICYFGSTLMVRRWAGDRVLPLKDYPDGVHLDNVKAARPPCTRAQAAVDRE
jgi:hypothetical protein